MEQQKVWMTSALAAWLAVAPAAVSAQAAMAATPPGTQPPYPSPTAYPLTIDRGAAGLWQSLQKIRTRASLMMVVAHPDDEDGGMLAYESRGQGVDTTLLTLNRGEGGQNVMTSDYWDQLGIMRTQELLSAGDYYGVHQRFTRVADFGFSKSLEEALKTWGHDRVLYDVVRQVRLTRPLVMTSVFAGNVSDGHGHHQTSGEMSQEAYRKAGDPTVFPDQIAAGLKPWSPLKVYARVPFARVEKDKGIFDYATGHWEPVRFRNYTNDTWIEGVPSTTLEIPEGNYNPLFGRSYVAVAREGLANQKSQNDGVGTPPARPFASPYHLYASRLNGDMPAKENTFFDGIDTSLAGIAMDVPSAERDPWKSKLMALQATADEAAKMFDAVDTSKSAPALARGLEQTRSLINYVRASSLPDDVKYNMDHELQIKQEQFNLALSQSLGISVVATVNPVGERPRMGPFGDMRGNTPTYQYAVPGQPVSVNVHIANQGMMAVQIDSTSLVGLSGDWMAKQAKAAASTMPAGEASDIAIEATVPANAPITKPYFSRPTLEQPYYNLDQPQYLGLPTPPFPLAARVLYTVAGVQASIEGTVQTTHRVNGIGPMLEPLLIAPAISMRLSPEAGVIPLTRAKLSMKVTLRSSVKGPAEGDVKLALPSGWISEPALQHFKTVRDGEETNLMFEVTPKNVEAKPYNITAVATYDGKDYSEGFTTVAWPGLRPYPSYRPARFRATGVDVKIAPNLKVGYIMGTGDDVPASLEDIGLHVNQLSAQDVSSSELKSYDAIILGIRAYANRPELRSYNNRLLEYVKGGGVVIVQYQTSEYDKNFGPYPISVPQDAEKVVDETDKVTILAENDPLLIWPNKITAADFDNWVEERGHGFAKTWDPKFIALTEMHDENQDPQKGGLLYANYGRGFYVYMAFAFFREIPEGVPGAYRIMANLISAGRNQQLTGRPFGPPAAKAAPAKKK